MTFESKVSLTWNTIDRYLVGGEGEMETHRSRIDPEGQSPPLSMRKRLRFESASVMIPRWETRLGNFWVISPASLHSPTLAGQGEGRIERGILTVVRDGSAHCPSYEGEQDEETEQDRVSALDVSIDGHLEWSKGCFWFEGSSGKMRECEYE